MGVYIKGMEIPKFCDACPFACWSNLHQTGSCDLLVGERCFDDYSTDYRTKRSERCPLVPVPPHGRLIEESKILDIVFEWCPDDDGSVGKVGDLREMLDEIEALPTIMPANEEGE